MKFDTAIIGGGLSGLVCGIKLAKQGKKCVIISSGQSALHFSSGSFDLLNALPDGSKVDSPTGAIDSLAQQAPEHPYAKLGSQRFAELTAEAEQFLKDMGVDVTGSAQQKHYRITPMGTLKPTWLTISDAATSSSESSLPWKSISLFNIDGFLDYYPQFIADELEKLGAKVTVHDIDLPELEIIRKSPSEFRSITIAKNLDKPAPKERIANIIKQHSANSDVVIFPACIGLDSPDTLKELREKVGKPIFLMPTMPPSLLGVRTQQHLAHKFYELGGVYMMGDYVEKAEVASNRVIRIFTRNHGDIPFEAEQFVLASGSFFSQGLIADPDRVYEPLFGLDVAFDESRESWYDVNLFNKQSYQSFGVKTTSQLNGVKDGQPIENLYVAGAILNGFNPIKEGCGGGVSILTALQAAHQILRKE